MEDSNIQAVGIDLVEEEEENPHPHVEGKKIDGGVVIVQHLTRCK